MLKRLWHPQRKGSYKFHHQLTMRNAGIARNRRLFSGLYISRLVSLIIDAKSVWQQILILSIYPFPYVTTHTNLISEWLVLIRKPSDLKCSRINALSTPFLLIRLLTWNRIRQLQWQSLVSDMHLWDILYREETAEWESWQNKDWDSLKTTAS